MTDEELQRRVAELRARGRSPKEIAQALDVRPAQVAAIVRTIAGREASTTPEPAVVGCWVSPGWRTGLTVAGHDDWPAAEAGEDGAGPRAGLVAVLVARAHRYDKVALCGWLLDVYRTGVKDVVGPRAVSRRELDRFVEGFFEGYPAPAVAAPVELARHLVRGAEAYARGLGFDQPDGGEAAAGHLGPLEGSSAITFGRDGRPCFFRSPRDDSDSVVSTLEASVGKDNFDVVEGDGDAPAARQELQRTGRPGAGGGSRRGPGEAVPGSRQWRSRNR